MKKYFAQFGSIVVIVALLVVGFQPQEAQAALVNDSNSSAQRTTSGTTLTWSHTVNSNTNGILIVIAETVDPNNVTGVTYAGEALTAITGASTQTADYRNVSIWYKLTPATGANDVVITGGTTATVKGFATAFTGADQTSPIGATATGTGGATAPSVAFTTSFDNSVIIAGLSQATNNPGAGGAGQTDIAANQSGNSHWGAGTREATTTAGSNTQSWTTAPDASGWGMAIAEIKEVQPTATKRIINVIFTRLDGKIEEPLEISELS